MDLTSEQVHRIGGAVIVVVVVLVLTHGTGVLRLRWIPYLVPLLLVAYGLESFLDTWIHGSAAPANYAAETTQHVIQGIAVLAAGVVEGLLLYGTINHRLWGLALPVALAVIGVVFLVHAQQDAGVPPLVLAVQHRVFALTLFVTALAKALALVPGDGTRVFSTAWLLPLLLFGLELMVYTEGSGSTSHAAH